MASDNEALGKWQGITLSIPDYLENVREDINDVAQYILTFLDIALAALNVVKVFVASFLNPIAAILQALIDEINAFINDLRQIGLYVNGDYHLLTFPFDDLAGGFSAYETRMVARLTDRTDPTRPDVSSRTDVFGAFFYFSAPVGEALDMVRYVKALLSFFRLDFPGGNLPSPRILSANPIAAGFFPVQLPDLDRTSDDPSSLVRVAWDVPRSTGKIATVQIPQPPPEGFVVFVSTRPGGLELFFDAPVNATDSQGKVPRRIGRLTDTAGTRLVLYGGADQVNLGGLGYNNATTSDGPTDAVRIFGLWDGSDTVPLPLELMASGSTRYFQRAHYVTPSVFNPFNWVGEPFTIDLSYDDLPHDAKLTVGSDGKISLEDKGKPANVYVSVVSVSGKAITQELKLDVAALVGAGADAAGGNLPVPLSGGLSWGSDVGVPSGHFPVSFESEFSARMLKAVETALTMLVLSASHLNVIDEVGSPPGAKALLDADWNDIFYDSAYAPTGLENFKPILRRIFGGELKSPKEDKPGFRQGLAQRIKEVAAELYREVGTVPEVEAAIIRDLGDFSSVTWAEIFSGSGDASIVSALPELRRNSASFASSTPLKSLSASGTKVGMECGLGSLRLGGDILVGLLSDRSRVLGRSPYFATQDLHAAGELYSEFLGRVRTSQVPEEISSLVGAEVADNLLGPLTLLGVVDRIFDADAEATKAELLNSLPPDLVPLAERYYMPDGTFVLPADVNDRLQASLNRPLWVGSGDKTPLITVNRNALQSGTGGYAIFTRGALGAYDGGSLYTRAALVLSYVASPGLVKGSGSWYSLRFLDTLPAIEDFLEVINGFLQALSDAIRNFAESILRLIAFLENRIRETQRLIRRINALLQSLLTFSFPTGGSALLLSSKGTGGLLADLLSATDKPIDSPGHYGAGVVIVAPFAPSFLVDLFTPAPRGSSINLPGASFSPESLVPTPPALPAGDDDPPDVL